MGDFVEESVAFGLNMQGMMGQSVICGQMGYISRESTPALAICAAILKENG